MLCSGSTGIKRHDGKTHLVEKLYFDDARGSNPRPQDVLFGGDVIWATNAVKTLQEVASGVVQAAKNISMFCDAIEK